MRTTKDMITRERFLKKFFKIYDGIVGGGAEKRMKFGVVKPIIKSFLKSVTEYEYSYLSLEELGKEIVTFWSFFLLFHEI